MLEITKELSTNRVLTFVNLSWNYLTCSDKKTPIKLEDNELKEMLKKAKKAIN